MGWAMIVALLESYSTIFYKKALWWFNLRFFNFEFFRALFWLLIVFWFILTWYVDVSFFKNYYLLFLIVLVICVVLLEYMLDQKIYKTEKISVIVPFENLSKAFSVIVGFIIFKWADTSFNSFLITLVAIFLIILGSFDFKTFRFPKNIYLILFWQTVTAVSLLLINYILSLNWVDEKVYISIFLITICLIYVLMIIYFKDYKRYGKLSKSFYFNLSVWWSTRRIWYIIGLFLMKEFGIVIAVLLSFVNLWLLLVLSWVLLKDKPSKKDLILAIIITSLIWLWFYYK